MKLIYKFLDDLFYSKLSGKAGIVRRWRWLEAIDRWQYRITRKVSVYFHHKHCQECQQRSHEDTT